MRAKTLLICDKETEYARRLAEYISSRHEYTFRVHYCDDMETAQALAGKMAIDYALIDNRFPEEERKEVKADRMFALTEHPGEEAADAVPVFKYRSAPQILKQVISTCLDDSQLTGCLQEGNRVRFICFYSPVGRLGRTSLALSVGKELAREDAVLYLNMCPHESGGRFEGIEADSLEEFVYFMRQEAPNPGLRLKNMTGNIDGMDVLLPFTMSEDLAEVESEEWEMLLDVLEQDTSYGVVILDPGESVRGLHGILGRCDEILMPVLPDETMAKADAFVRELKEHDEADVAEMIRRVNMEENHGKLTHRLAHLIRAGRAGSGEL